MARISITLTLEWRWCLRSYLFGVLLMARLMRCEPNWDRVGYWIGKGIKLKAR